MVVSAAIAISLVVGSSAGAGSADSGVPPPGLLRTAAISFDAPVLVPPRAEESAWPAALTPRVSSSGLRRPAALPVMYGAFAALQVADVYSTTRGIAAGRTELNPAMRPLAGSAGTMLAVKALSSAASLYFVEKAWKKKPKAAVVLMGAVNGVLAAAVATNLRRR
jgi:hypothetical protein